MLCFGFELLGSKHSVALPCPSAGTLKVLGETHPAILAQGEAGAGARAGSSTLAHSRVDI